MNTIRFLKRNELDETKWNHLIARSTLSLPYAFSWYLDAVSENWGALVMGDYKAVLPLVWLSRLGIKCLYQPYYCQQLGFFSNVPLAKNEMEEFISLATKKFPYVNIQLNSSASLIAAEAGISSKKNLLLDLNKDYPKLKKEYSENHRRNIAKANKAEFIFSESVDLKKFQGFYLENINREKEKFKEKHERIFIKLSKELITGKHGKNFAATNADGKLFAAVLFIFHQKRMIGIINTSSSAGKKNGASHFLLDQIIQKFSGSDLALDFEGSSVPSIARFYEGFGAQPEVFYNYRYTIIKNAMRIFEK